MEILASRPPGQIIIRSPKPWLTITVVHSITIILILPVMPPHVRPQVIRMVPSGSGKFNLQLLSLQKIRPSNCKPETIMVLLRWLTKSIRIVVSYTMLLRWSITAKESHSNRPSPWAKMPTTSWPVTTVATITSSPRAMSIERTKSHFQTMTRWL